MQLYSEHDVKGLQFDLVYKDKELELSESSIISLFDNIDVYVNKVNRGRINILMLGLIVPRYLLTLYPLRGGIFFHLPSKILSHFFVDNYFLCGQTLEICRD